MLLVIFSVISLIFCSGIELASMYSPISPDSLTKENSNNNGEYSSENIILIENHIKTWISFMDDTMLRIMDSLETTSDTEKVFFRYGNRVVSELKKSKDFIDTYIPHCLYRYINNITLEKQVENFKNICRHLEENYGELLDLEDKNLSTHYQYEDEIQKLPMFLNNLKSELLNPFLDGFIILSQKIKEYESSLNELKCGMCDNKIHTNYCFFSLSCGHKIHLECGHSIDIDTDNCLICGANFWDRIDHSEEMKID